jgi:hypothetical protein
MTCIVGLVDDGAVYMGGDSAGVEGLRIGVRADEKVFHLNEKSWRTRLDPRELLKPVNHLVVMGFTSSFRMGQLLQYNLRLPKGMANAKDLYGFMVTDFISAVRETLKEGGYSKVSENVESGGTFLVGLRGRLFCIEDDFQVGENIESYHAVGCGSDLALGSMYATGKMGLPPRERVHLALEAAETWSAGVSQPFVIKSVK